ncbi:MAG: hypothetical protein AMXMBFR42_26120 [Burkholderiales bacterium]
MEVALWRVSFGFVAAVARVGFQPAASWSKDAEAGRGGGCDAVGRRSAGAAVGAAGSRRRTAVVEGATPWLLIVEQEQECDCDLVVVDKHGRHAREDLLLGSTTPMVIAESGADVLMSSMCGQ